MKKRQVKTKDEARQYAIDWQSWAGEQNLSYGELHEWGGIFTELGKKYDLTEEFHENGIVQAIFSSYGALQSVIELHIEQKNIIIAFCSGRLAVGRIIENKMKLKLHRDIVISVVKGRDLVGVYAKVKPKDNALYYENKILGEKYGYLYPIKETLSVMLAEMSPEKADQIISLWNSE